MRLRRPRSTDNDWRLSCDGTFPQAGCSLDAIHARHTDVHENQIRLFRQSLLHANFAVVGLDYMKTEMTNECSEQLAAVSVIFDYQDFIRHRLGDRSRARARYKLGTSLPLDGILVPLMPNFYGGRVIETVK